MLNPNDVTAFLASLLKCPKKRTLFITVRCPTQKSVWTKIGKINDWIRKYSSNYWIVRGMAGGIHFHLMALVRPDAQIRYPKGIHFRVSPIGIKDSTWSAPEQYEIDLMLDARAYYKGLKDYILRTYKVPEECIMISRMITNYWRLRRNRDKRKKAVECKDSDLRRVSEYMYKNLAEPRGTDERIVYLDYILRHTPSLCK